jgi:CRP/FNR family transcriptional regulator, anaerobic regulatory protein
VPGPEACSVCEARPFSICAPLRGQELVELDRLSTTLRYPAGATFVHEGDPPEHCFNITSGSAKFYKLLPDGRRQIIGFLFTGDFLGTAPRGPYGFTAEAMSPMSVCRFERPAFQAVLARLPNLEHALLERTADELEAAREQMLLLGRKAAKERVASFLLSLSRRAARLGRASDPVQLPMGRADIADYLGLTTETVSRVMTQLRTEGLIRLNGSSEVHLLRRPQLESLCEGS